MSEIEISEVSKMLALPTFLIRDLVSYEFNGKKLEHSRDSDTKFDIEKVNEYRIHLDSTWSENQREPPEFIKRYIIYESGNVCSVCRQHKPVYQFAHIESWARTRSHNPHNLLYLCLDCHATVGNNHKLLQAIKEELIRKYSLVFADKIYECDTDISPGDSVYGIEYKAHKALATEDPTMLATGLVCSKIGTDRCVIQRTGVVTCMSDLIPGEEYFLSQEVPGQLVRREHLNQSGVLQLLGRAESISDFALVFWSYVKYHDLKK
jgi:hypothetical protein